MVEDETDVQAAKQLKAEVVHENDEFDEVDDRQADDAMDKVENELKLIENEVSLVSIRQSNFVL
jgi:hypothetical protein